MLWDNKSTSRLYDWSFILDYVNHQKSKQTKKQKHKTKHNTTKQDHFTFFPGRSKTLKKVSQGI